MPNTQLTDPKDRLLDPVDPSVWLYVALGVLLVLLVAWVALRIWRFQSKKYRVKVHRVTATQREMWERRIREIVAEHSETDEQARMVHISLAAALREMLSERTRRKIQSWTPDEMRRLPQLRETADLIDSWEQPSFAPYAKSNVAQAGERALAVVRSW